MLRCTSSTVLPVSLFSCLLMSSIPQSTTVQLPTIDWRSLSNFASSSRLGDLKILINVLSECLRKDFTLCIKVKAVSAFDQAVRAGNLPLTDTLTFVRINADNESSTTPPLTEEELESNLPRSLDDKDKSLDYMLMGRLKKFLKTHAIRYSLDYLVPGVALKFSKRPGDNELVDMYLEYGQKPKGKAYSEGRKYSFYIYIYIF